MQSLWGQGNNSGSLHWDKITEVKRKRIVEHANPGQNCFGTQKEIYVTRSLFAPVRSAGADGRPVLSGENGVIHAAPKSSTRNNPRI
jgi:hypothetical protein